MVCKYQHKLSWISFDRVILITISIEVSWTSMKKCQILTTTLNANIAKMSTILNFSARDCITFQQKVKLFGVIETSEALTRSVTRDTEKKGMGLMFII